MASGAAHASTVTTGIVYNNTAGDFNTTFAVDALHDQSGLSAGYTSGVTDFASYTASTTHSTSGGGGVSWFSDGVPNFPAVLDFDLGSQLNISQLALWNGSVGNNAAVNAFQVFTSNDALFGTSTFAGAFNNPIGVSGPEPATVFDILDTSARYVRLQLDSYFGNSCCVSIGEVAFATVPIPLPAGIPLLVTGLGAFALMRRRKRPS